MTSAKSYDTILALEDAVEKLMAYAMPTLKTEAVPLMSALYRVASEDIYAPISLPPFDRSPLDGYTFQARDIAKASTDAPVVLKVIGEVCAGCGDVFTPHEGQAVRIMTGGQMPPNCDCVVRQEDTEELDGFVRIFAPMKSDMNVCHEGEDTLKGTLIIAKGTRLTYVHLGVLGGLGIKDVQVYHTLKVGLMATGDELIPPGQPLTRGKIYNTNQPLLMARLLELHTAPMLLAPSLDDPETAAKAIRDLWDEVDVMITTGGVSVGKKDIMHQVLPLAGCQRIFWRVALKPGTPVLCGEKNGKLLICLSGNPFASICTFELLAKPVIAALSGDIAPTNRRITVPLQGSFPKYSPSRRFIRANFDGTSVHIVPRSHESGSLTSMMGCNCLIDIPERTEKLENGDMVTVVLI